MKDKTTSSIQFKPRLSHAHKAMNVANITAVSLLVCASPLQAALMANVPDPEKSDKVLICHVPPGNPENAKTLSISPDAVVAAGHDTHPDDSDGACAAPAPVAPAVECQAQLGSSLRFNFNNPTLISGDAANISAIGTAWRFPTVSTGIDALVEIVGNQDARLIHVDVPSAEEEPSWGMGLKWAFQPQVQPTIRATGEYYIEFKISFVETGTTIPSNDVLNSFFLASSVDIDGDGDGSAIREFVEYGNFYQYFLEEPTQLLVSDSTLAPGAKKFLTALERTLPGITPFNTVDQPYASEHMVTGKYDGTDTFVYRAGVKLDSDTPGTYDDRLFSLYFNCVNYDTPNVLYDMGDAPDSYGIARHTLSETTSGSGLYLGSVPPDHESDFLSKKAKKADAGFADDALEDDDEDALSSTPSIGLYDTSFTLASTAIPLVNKLASDAWLYGFIDFNRDGDFLDTGESVRVHVPSGSTAPSTDLTWSGFSGVTAGPTFARLRLSTDSSLTASGIAADGEVEDYAFTVEDTPCTGLTGEVTEAELPLTQKLKTNDTLFLPSSDVSAGAGHLRAYPINKDGKPAATATWDAATLMTAEKRKSRLYSTKSDGNLGTFDSLNEVAFNSSKEAATTIKANTYSPPSGNYLGPISRGNSLAILDSVINTRLYLYNTNYRDYYEKHIATRNKLVLVTSDDGFLYAFDYVTGELVWGWIPRSLVSELQQGLNFQNQRPMAGDLTILDLPDANGNFKSYLVGSYKHGLGHFVLRLKDDGTLDKLIWDEDASGAYSSAPGRGKMEFFRDANNTVHGAYVLTTSAGSSRLQIRNLVDPGEITAVDLNHEITSTPFVMPDFGRHNAPPKKALYLGTANGDLYQARLLAADGTIDTATNLKSALEATPIINMDDSPTDAVTAINATVSASNNRYYLVAQTATRLTVSEYDSAAAKWHKKWTSYASGAGTWNETGTYSADASGVPTNRDGFLVVPPGDGIQSLPADAMITDPATVVADTIVLPITDLPGSSAICYGQALYYLYSLTNGKYPKNAFYNPYNTVIDTNIALGYGEARQLAITDLLGKDQLTGYGLADKKADMTTGIGSPFIIRDPVSTGIRGWKEMGRSRPKIQQPSCASGPVDQDCAY